MFSSEFRRARETAEIIAGQLGLQAEIVADLHERDFGSLRGEPYSRMGAMMRGDARYDPKQRWLWTPEQGESLEDVRVRAIEGLRKVAAACSDGGDVVVVSHGAVMEAVAAHLANSWENARVPDNCGVTLVEFSQLFR